MTHLIPNQQTPSKQSRARTALFFFICAIFFLRAYSPVYAATVCVCSTAGTDCESVQSMTNILSQSDCENACKKQLTTEKKVFASAQFGKDFEAEKINASCTAAHDLFVSGNKQEKADIPPINPVLNVAIPGLTFTNAITEPCSYDKNSQCVKTNFLGEYLTAVMNFIFGAGVIIVIVLIMVGGFQYVLGAVKPDYVGKGKERIKNAVTGLILLMCVYVIVKTTNPQLTIFKTIEAQNIPPVEFDFGPDTLSEEEKAQDAGGGGGTGTGTYVASYYSSCPVTLTNPNTYNEKNPKNPGNINKNIPRRIEFHSKVRSLLTGSAQQRVLKAIEATAACQIHYENCGVGTTNIYALAAPPGKYGDTCLANTNPKTPCNILGNKAGNIKKKMVYNVAGDSTSYGKVSSLLRGFFCASVPQCKTPGWTAPCFTDKNAASAKLKEILKQTKWSPNWIDKLQPGDYYMVVNWNPSCQATHSAMFVKWEDKANHVAWVESGDAAHFVRIRKKTFDPSDLIIQISRPVD